MQTIIQRYNEYLKLISQLQEERRINSVAEDRICFYGSYIIIGKIVDFGDGTKTVRINNVPYNGGIHFSESDKFKTAKMFAELGFLGSDLKLYCSKCKSFNIEKRDIFLPLCKDCDSVKHITYESTTKD